MAKDNGSVIPVKAEGIESVRNIGLITGENGFLNTMETFDVYGTDLGIPYYDEELKQLTFLFGDTYSAKNFSGNWRSNVAMYTRQTDFSDGVIFDGALTAAGAKTDGTAIQITPGANPVFPLLKGDYVKTKFSHTCIPTGAVDVNGTIYLFYMEIDKNAFLPNGEWGVNSNRVIKSDNHGESWVQVSSMEWQAKDENGKAGNAPNFSQIYPLKADGYVYIYGLEGGRSGGTKLGRVLEADIENLAAYEYYAGCDANGDPIWREGERGLQYILNRSSAYVIDPTCGEMCVTYNRYLQKYLALYQSGSNIIMRTSSTPWGPFSTPQVILSTSTDLPGGYGAFTCEQWSADGGKKIYIAVSQWEPVYNVNQVEITFQ